jgi:hypothetical protein
MYTDVGKVVQMVLKGESAEMMIQMAPQVYQRYVTVNKKGLPVLYVKLPNALYGLMRASLLFYRKLCKELGQYVYKMNPYNPCVANIMMACGNQLIVI